MFCLFRSDPHQWNTPPPFSKSFQEKVMERKTKTEPQVLNTKPLYNFGDKTTKFIWSDPHQWNTPPPVSRSLEGKKWWKEDQNSITTNPTLESTLQNSLLGSFSIGLVAWSGALTAIRSIMSSDLAMPVQLLQVKFSFTPKFSHNFSCPHDSI